MTTFILPARRTKASTALRKAVRALPLLALGAAVTATAAEPVRPASKQQQPKQQVRTVVDHAVQPAGGGCRQCGPGGCQPGHAHRHHHDCRDGVCVPYCPVRPSTFGFYGTQWRRWPGQGVAPVSHEEAATPVKPPKSAVPGVDEESIGPKASELPEPDYPQGDSAAAERSPLAPEPTAPEPTTPTEPEPGPAAAESRPDEPRATAPRDVPRGEEKPVQPEAAPAKPRPEDENLFDDSAARKVRRKIPTAGTNQPASRAAAVRVQPATHHEERPEPSAARRAAGPKPVPRVPFDPRQESARMRQAK